jgi:glycosyltransferase involved in cell wall biosynthesis
MLPISVFIITKNEEDRIEKVINAVKNFADEILVIDSGSVDKTVELSQSAGAQVYFNQWNGYGQQKIFGEQKNMSITTPGMKVTICSYVRAANTKEKIEIGKVNFLKANLGLL